MKTLYILRHAKSSWDDATISDFDRPLNSRGLTAAPFMGTVMKDRGDVPDVIISSPAERARQTADLVKIAAGFTADIAFDHSIYDATVGMLLSVIAALRADVRSALVVGHNPGIENLVFYLTGQISPMPTAALAVIELDLQKWHDVSGNCGSLQKIIRPKDEM